MSLLINISILAFTLQIISITSKFGNFLESDQLKILLDEKNIAISSNILVSTVSPVNFTQIFSLTGHTGSVNSLVELDNGLFASAGNDKNIIIWNRLEFYKIKKILTGHTMAVTSLAKLQNGFLSSGSADNSILIWDMSFNLIQTLNGHTGAINSLVGLWTFGLCL